LRLLSAFAIFVANKETIMAIPQIMGNSPGTFPFIGEAKAKHALHRPYRDENENIQPMTLEEFYAMIDRAEEDIRAGRTISQEEMEKRVASWFSQ
jgi:hypothetical protein